MLYLLSSLNLNFYSSEPMAYLFFNHVGFMDPGSSRGVIGSYLNPAVLAKTGNGFEAYFGYSTSASTPPDSFTLDLPVSMDSLTYELRISPSVVFSDVGGPDYLGLAYKFGPLAFGGSIFRPSAFGVSLSGDVPLEYRSDSFMTFGYTVGDGDGDSVALNLTPYGTLKGTLYPFADIKIGEFPMFIGVGVGNRIVSAGFGINLRRIEGSLDFNARISADSGTELSAKVSPADPDWDVRDLRMSLVYGEDTMFLGSMASGSFSATYLSPTVGLNLNLFLIGLNLAAEMGLSGSTTARFSTTLILPDSADLQVLSSSVSIDSTTRTVSGDLTLAVRRTGDTSVSKDFSTTYRLARYVGVRGGVRFLVFSLSGAAEFPVEFGDGLFYYGKNYLTPNVVLPVGPLEGRVGAVLMWRYAFFGRTVIPSSPMFYVGGGLSLRARLGTPSFGIDRLDLGVRGGFLSYLVKALAEGLSEGSLEGFRTEPTTAASLGVRFYVR